MKYINLSQTLSSSASSQIFSENDLELANLVLIEAKKEMHPNIELFASINYIRESQQFLNEQLMLAATSKILEHTDGVVIDEVFTNDHHGLNDRFLKELSMSVGQKHLIIGPTFSQVPSFLQSKLIEELINFDVSGVMYDVRKNDMEDYAALQPLAKLLMHVKKRTSIIPLVKTKEDADTLGKILPVNVIAIEE